MNIAVNARALLNPTSGVEAYLLGLFPKIARGLGIGHQLSLLSPAPLPVSIRETIPEATLISGYRNNHAKNNLLSQAKKVLWEKWSLRFELRQTNSDIFHSPTYTSFFKAPCKHVVTLHDLAYFINPKFFDLRTKLYLRAFFKNLHRFDRIICVSESTRSDLLNRFPHLTNKTLVIYNGRDEFYKPLSKDDLFIEEGTLRRPFFLNVSTLSPRKNLITLIQAFQKLVSSGIDIDLKIVGGRGWRYSDIFSVVKQLDLEERVVFLGYVDKSTLLKLYNTCAAFVFPSLYEGFGFPIVEAMSCGAPVITSNISSMPEIAGDSALLINPHSAYSIVDAMDLILRDAALRRDLSQRGLERSKKFSWDTSAQSTLSVYNSLL